MNKKGIVLIGFFLFANVFSFAGTTLQTEIKAQEELQKSIEQKNREARQKSIEIRNWEMTQILKTYQLKHIKPEDLINAARLLIVDSTAYKNTVTVKIINKNVLRFEELLKKIDVEKKTLLFKVYTILASTESEENDEQTGIKDKRLRQVLNELENLWNFKTYVIDNPYFITVTEESGSNYFRLASKIYPLGIHIQNVHLNSAKPGERNITIGQIQLLRQYTDQDDLIFIDSKSVVIKEDGYLVVGASGLSFPSKGRVLILVISAEIKD